MTRRSSRRAALLVTTPLMWGCTRPTFELDDVRIVGGNPEQRQAVRDALLAFDAAVGPGRVRLSEIVFDDLEGFAGRYTMEPKRIVLLPTLDAVRIPLVVRHELCHAIDHQETLSPAQGAALDVLTPVFLDDGDIVDYPTHEDQRMETFADLCGHGPEVATLLAQACPDDPTYVAPVLAWMSDEVWRGGTWFPPSTVERAEVVSWRASTSPDEMHVLPAYLGGSPVFDLVVLGSFDQFALVDPYTGEPVVFDPELGLEEETSDLDEDEVAPFDGGTLSGQEGWSVGPAVALAEAKIPNLGTYRRLVYRSGPGPWERVPDLCPAEVMDLAALDERVWYAWAEGDLLSWTAFTP